MPACLEFRSQNGVNSRHCTVASWTQSINTIGRAEVSHLISSVYLSVQQEEDTQNKCNVQIGSYYTDAACLITTLTASYIICPDLVHPRLLTGPIQIICVDGARYDEQLFRNFGDNSLWPRCHNWPTRGTIIAQPPRRRGQCATYNATEIALQSHAEHMIAIRTDIINK